MLMIIKNRLIPAVFPHGQFKFSFLLTLHEVQYIYFHIARYIGLV
jgi:hypothetical protein